MYAAPPVLQTTVFARIPDSFRIKGRTNRWIDVQRGGAPTDCFLEGPSFDRTGLATTNLAYGGAGNKVLYITESESGSVLTVPLEVPGNTMFSHR